MVKAGQIYKAKSTSGDRYVKVAQLRAAKSEQPYVFLVEVSKRGKTIKNATSFISFLTYDNDSEEWKLHSGYTLHRE